MSSLQTPFASPTLECKHSYTLTPFSRSYWQFQRGTNWIGGYVRVCLKCGETTPFPIVGTEADLPTLSDGLPIPRHDFYRRTPDYQTLMIAGMRRWIKTYSNPKG